MKQKLSDTLVKVVDRSNPLMQNLQLAARFNKLIDEGGDADLEDNKAVTINASTYSAPVEVTPTEGKDAMKKTTVTLSNIPSGQVNAYCWGDNDFKFYTDFSSAPISTPSDCYILMVDDGLVKKTPWEDVGFDDYTYEKVDDSTIKLTLIEDPTDVLTLTRLSVNDFVLW